MMSNGNAIDFLMNSARNGRKRKRFPCPGGCGRLVTRLDVNDHLDRCIGAGADADDAGDSGCRDERGPPPEGGTENLFRQSQSTEIINSSPTAKRRLARSPRPSPRSRPANAPSDDAFSHMMKRSAAVFANAEKGQNFVRHRFHLHDAEGFVTWTSEDGADENDVEDVRTKEVKGGTSTNEVKPSSKKTDAAASAGTEEVHWSATVAIPKKKIKSVDVDGQDEQRTPLDGDIRALELTMSSSLPLLQRDESQRLVRRHSRLSVSHLKSCLQKSIRRRAPLPAVRVAMELADRSWGDLIRRLPIIVLEDSSLHPNFGLLVWLMVADSKGYFPCMSLLKRVFQIVFEVASCPQQDVLTADERAPQLNDHDLPSSISLITPSSILFPDQRDPKISRANSREVLIRSILLRAQYGGMKCDIAMLHSFATAWLKRFCSAGVPASFAPPSPESAPRHVDWLEVPRILHEKARERSVEIVASGIVRPGCVSGLGPADVCAAGIDFHCSPVIDHLLSRPGLRSSLGEMLAPLENGGKDAADREWMSKKIKSLMWNYSSGVNYRRPIWGKGRRKDDPASRAVWADLLKAPFDDYTKRFVRDRLSSSR